MIVGHGELHGIGESGGLGEQIEVLQRKREMDRGLHLNGNVLIRCLFAASLTQTHLP